MPDNDERANGSIAGVYEDSRGDVCLSYKVKEILRQSEMDWRDVVAKAIKFVMRTPEDRVLRDILTSDASGSPAKKISFASKIPIPTSVAKAMAEDSDCMFKYSTLAEWNGLCQTDTFQVCDMSDPKIRARIIASGGIIPTHGVYTWKEDTLGNLIKPKFRFVAGGNYEPAPDNAFANYSPTAGPSLNRTMDAYCIYRGFIVWSTDCAQAFLNSPTGLRDIFISIPPGLFKDPRVRRNFCLRLRKYLYGLTRSPLEWSKNLSNTLKAMGFVEFDDNPCMLRLVRENPDGSVSEIMAEVFVDDIKWGFNDEDLAKEIICKLGDKYKTTAGDQVLTTDKKDSIDWPAAVIADYLGMRYSQTWDERTGFTKLTVNQTSYITKVVERFELQDCKAYKDRHTPLPGGSNTNRVKAGLGDYENDEDLKAWAKKYSYPMIMGSLIHAMVHTRPDIAYAVSLLSRATANPELWHFKAAQHLILYLRSTRDLGLTYDQEKMWNHEAHVTAATDHRFDPYFEAAVDASFADDEETNRSTSGFVVWFGGSPIEWECKRQPLVTLSTMESEYVAASRCVQSIRFLHKFLNFVSFSRDHPTKVLEDNAACIAISEKPVHRQRSKHIAVKFHNVREASLNGEVKLHQVATEHQVADLFTKSLDRKLFSRFRDTLLGTVPFNGMVRNTQKTPVPSVKYVTNTQSGSWPEYVVPTVPGSFLGAILGTGDIEEM
jgi:hypothetical protein